MQLTEERLLLSASDLVNFLACRHLTTLEFGRAHGRVPDPPQRAADTAELVARRGDEFEQHHLEAWPRHGRSWLARAIPLPKHNSNHAARITADPVSLIAHDLIDRQAFSEPISDTI